MPARESPRRRPRPGPRRRRRARGSPTRTTATRRGAPKSSTPGIVGWYSNCRGRKPWPAQSTVAAHGCIAPHDSATRGTAPMSTPVVRSSTAHTEGQRASAYPSGATQFPCDTKKISNCSSRRAGLHHFLSGDGPRVERVLRASAGDLATAPLAPSERIAAPESDVFSRVALARARVRGAPPTRSRSLAACRRARARRPERARRSSGALTARWRVRGHRCRWRRRPPPRRARVASVRLCVCAGAFQGHVRVRIEALARALALSVSRSYFLALCLKVPIRCQPPARRGAARRGALLAHRTAPPRCRAGQAPAAVPGGPRRAAARRLDHERWAARRRRGRTRGAAREAASAEPHPDERGARASATDGRPGDVGIAPGGADGAGARAPGGATGCPRSTALSKTAAAAPAVARHHHREPPSRRFDARRKRGTMGRRSRA